MEAMTKSWTDERLEERFDRIDWQHDRFDDEARAMRAEMNARFDAMQRLIIQVGAGIIATNLVGFLGIIATQL